MISCAKRSQNLFRKRGFTLVELLVVIAIIGILIALLLPAVQAAREAARRSQCNNNMKQLGLAMHNYYDTHKVFPYNYRGTRPNPGFTHNRDSWFHRILPYIEQGTLYDQYEAPPQTAHAWHENGERREVVSTLCCPSDGNSPGEGGSGNNSFQGNLVVCTGDYYRLNPVRLRTMGDGLRGIFFAYSDTTMADIVDGTSNTLMVSEGIIRRRSGSRWGWGGAGSYWGGAPHGGTGFCTYEPPNTPLPDQVYECKDEDFRHAPCVSLFGGERHNFARSYHPGGVNAGLADGSVRFISETIEFTTYRALGTRREGEVIGQF